MSESLIRLSGAVVSNPLRRMAAPIDFELCEGEHIALVGLNGSGKSTLAGLIAGGWYLREGTMENRFRKSGYHSIKTISFNGAYSTTEIPYYHQQRWQAFERDAAPHVRELLEKTIPGEPARDPSYCSELYEMLGIAPLLEKPIITLSSGELRRYHFCKALMDRPQMLILENPFMGLDPATRDLINEIMEITSSKLGVCYLMTATSLADLPKVISHVYFLEEMKVSRKYSRDEAFTAPEVSRLEGQSEETPFLPGATDANPPYDNVAELRNIHVAYGERVIFESLDWTVRKGDAWRVFGRNGSGKSTLLSLVCADNPSAYSMDITLFDRKRGTGESIWDIKKRIGYLSSEMHSSINVRSSALAMVASGLKDTIGEIYRVPEESREICMTWMRAFGAENLAERNYMTLSSGEQRLVLLIRAFVKDPELLVLDEPFQGLDRKAIIRAKGIIEEFCSRPGKTLLFVTHFNDTLPSIIDKTMDLNTIND